MKKFRFFCWLAMVGLAASTASAATIGVVPAPPFYQNTDASPCVIGGENCKGTIPYTVSGSGGDGSTFDKNSPTYLISDLMPYTIGSQFSIGIDFNDTKIAQTLNSFSMVFCSATVAVADDPVDCAVQGGSTTQTYLYDGLFDFKTTHNGVGYSDFVMGLFDFNDANGTATIVQFQANWFNNDGPDRFFIIAGDADEVDNPPEVPEPSSMLLMGGGLLGLAWWRKRKNS